MVLMARMKRQGLSASQKQELWGAMEERSGSELAGDALRVSASADLGVEAQRLAQTFVS